MRRAMAVLLVLTAAVGFSNAQVGEPNPKPNPDWKGEGAFVFRGVTTDIPLSDLILVTCEFTGISILYDPKKVSGDVSIVAPRDGFKVTKDRMQLMLADCLEEFRLALVPKGDVWTIVPAVEAVTYAPTLTEAELENANDAHWVIVHVALENLDANAVTGALRNLTSRQGGMVNPVQPRSLIIGERADRLKDLVKLANDMDAAAATTIVNYELAEGTNAGAVAEALSSLFPPGPGNPTSFSSALGGKHVIARATAADHALIAEAVKVVAPKEE